MPIPPVQRPPAQAFPWRWAVLLCPAVAMLIATGCIGGITREDTEGRDRNGNGIESLDEVRVPASLPNPYVAPSADWGTAPPGREWGRVSAVAMDVDREHVWIAERCGGDVCVGSDVPVVLRYDPEGTLTRSFGADMFVRRPHGIHVDAEGNVWVTDVRSVTPEELAEHPEDARKGHQVIKFSPEGEVLLVLGNPGEAGDPPARLNEPTDIVTAANGNIYVSQGHSAVNPVQRISRFSADGTYLGSWGSPGAGPGEFLVPHALAVDSQDRVFVADRGNSRVQIFDAEGRFLAAWTQFGRPSDVFVTDDDELLTVDYESGGEINPDFRRRSDFTRWWCCTRWQGWSTAGPVPLLIGPPLAPASPPRAGRAGAPLHESAEAVPGGCRAPVVLHSRLDGGSSCHRYDS